MSDYLPMVPVPSTADNPYSGVVDALSNNQANDSSTSMSATPGMNQNIAAQTTAMNQYGASTSGSSYPAMPNQYGLGSPVAATPAPTASQPTQNSSTSTPDVTARGMTPWSLQGEALSR